MRQRISFVSLCLLQVIILIGNKADLEAQRDVTYEEAKQFAEENGERKNGLIQWKVSEMRRHADCFYFLSLIRFAVPGSQRQDVSVQAHRGGKMFSLNTRSQH